MRRFIRFCLTAAGILGGAAAAHAQAAGVVRFCAGVDNLPMSQDGQPSGFEVEIARAAAAHMGKEAQFVWLRPHAENFEEAVLQGRCDAALGAIIDPGAMAGDWTPPGVVLSKPYYAAGYRLIARSGAKAVRHLDDLPPDERLAVQGRSIGTYLVRRRDHKVHVVRRVEDVVNVVAGRRTEYGYMWGPLAAWMLKNREDVKLVEGFVPEESWRFALAVREDDAALRQALDSAIEALIESGTAGKILGAYGLSWQDPRS
jgi:ABC-type amino acid transport substrate-binding protein